MWTNMLPLHIDFSAKEVLIVGGGKIALRRLKTFLHAGANITVVSPEACEEITRLAEQNEICWKQEKVSVEHLHSPFLIVAATHDHDVNEWIGKNTRPNQLVNIASKMEKGNVLIPKIVKKGKLTLSISTNGASPTLAKELGEKLSSQFDDDFIKELDMLYEERQKRIRRR